MLSTLERLKLATERHAARVAMRVPASVDDPGAFLDFCQPAGSGIIIMEPADVTLDPGLDPMLDYDVDEFDAEAEFDAILPADDEEGEAK